MPTMDSIQKGLRSGALKKDNYERLICAEDDVVLKRRDNPDGIGVIRKCPECGIEYEDVG